MILIAYTLSVLLRVTWAVLYEIKSGESIQCVFIDNSIYALKPLDGLGEFIMVLNQVTQLVPHILLPVALYVIPASSFKRNGKI